MIWLIDLICTVLLFVSKDPHIMVHNIDIVIQVQPESLKSMFTGNFITVSFMNKSYAATTDRLTPFSLNS